MQILDNVTQEFLNALSQDMSLIQDSARMLFYYLVVIQIALSALWMALAGESLQRFLTKLVQLSFSFGFFYALIQFGGKWIPDLLNGFIEIGQKGGVYSLDPSSIVDQGLSISGAIFHAFFGWGLLGHPFVSLLGAVICISILILYGLIAAELVIVLVKSYIVVSAGSLFFAFGASEYTREMTKNYFSAAIGLGLNLMALYLLLGVGQHIGQKWAAMTAKAASQHALMPMLVILATIIVYYMVLKNIPAFIAGLAGIGGFRNYGGAVVGMAINAGMTGAGTLMNTARLSGRSVQAGTQAALASGYLGQSFYRGLQSDKPILLRIKDGAIKAGKHGAVSAGNTVKDMALRQNQNLTIGQKFNKHLANKLKK